MYTLRDIYLNFSESIYHLGILVTVQHWTLGDLTMRTKTINPVAKALLQSNRRRSQVVPDKTKYNRKKDKHNANQDRKHEEPKDN
jgi:hypothetical protein